MNTWKKGRLILFGGKIHFPSAPNDPQQTTEADIIFQRYSLYKFLVGILVVFALPFLCIPSSIGFVEYDYPPEFLEKSLCAQYWLIFSNNLSILLKNVTHVDLFFPPTIPKPSADLWKVYLGISFLLGDGIACFLILNALANIRRNKKAFKSERLKFSMFKEVEYACVLPFVSPKRKK